MRSTLTLLVSLWFVASVAAVTTSKLVLSTLHPLELCTAQFAAATLIERALLTASRAPRLLRSLEEAEAAAVTRIALSYTLGFVFTNAAFAMSTASTVETIKAAEPISTVLIAYAMLGEIEKLRTYASLLLVVIGVALASCGDGNFSALSFASTLGANLGFSGRTCLTKKLKRDHPASPCALSEACLFFHVSVIGLRLLVPALLMRRLAIVVRSGQHDAGGIGQGTDAAEEAWARRFSEVTVALLVALNGVCYTLYNQFSWMVMARVSTATHALLNMLRRVVVICFAAAFFGVRISFFNGVGVALAVIGVLAFGRSKATSSRQGKRVTSDGRSLGASNVSQDLLLPLYSDLLTSHLYKSIACRAVGTSTSSACAVVAEGDVRRASHT